MNVFLNMLTLQRRTSIEEITDMKNNVLFVSNQVSHDVRTPITHIMNICESICNKEHSDKDLEELQYSCESVKNIMESWLLLLNTSITSETRQKVVFVQEFFQKLSMYTERSIHISGKQIIYHQEGVNNLPVQLKLDSTLLYHVLTNLLSNAVKYTHEGHIILQAALQTENLEVSISDTGIGIAIDNQTRIFKKFEQVNYHENSNGLGLNMVKTLLDQGKGTIVLKSSLDEGSKFTITLPVQKLIERTTTNLSKLKLLLVEDNVTCLRMFKIMLQPANVTCMEDGALVMPEMLQNFYDVVLLDGTLPNMSGEQIIRHIEENELFADVGIVFIGGSSINCSGRIILCQKPFTKTDLIAAVMKASKIHQRNRNNTF